ncbi:hypothetical protein V6U90_06690 [Micromonospora sp. CPCC 206060]|uniref:hypothetical protein n=1 Tax=Micromonospora sp. CPCC 206060 TaxID=3122406 RepID=UPI002FEEF920
MAARVVELRVHGVSNTPPADILCLTPEPGNDGPTPWLVAGDAMTGFYRSTAPDPAEPVAVEAYSWGQLTSGARTAKDVERALWTALLPFTLANVALHARPDIPADPETERWRDRPGVAAWLIRLFCLSLTGTLVLAATGIGVDLIGWQCVDNHCLRRIPGPWEFLGSGWWGTGAHSLAIGLLVPLGLLTVIGLLTWRTYQYEAAMPAGTGAPDPGPLTNPLQDPTFWCGEGQVRRAAVLHLCTGVVIASAVPLGAVLVMDPPTGGRAILAWSTVSLLAVPLVITLVALGQPYLSRRAGDTPLGPWSALIAVLTLAGLVGTVALLLLPDGPAGIPLADQRPPDGCTLDGGVPGCREDRSLPGFDWIIAWYGTGQAILLLAIGAVSRSGRRALLVPATGVVLIVLGCGWLGGWLPGAPPAPDWLSTPLVAAPAVALAALGLLLPRTPSASGGSPPHRQDGVAWGGCGPAVLAGFGWLLGIAYSAGGLYWATDWLNNGATPSGLSAITPPLPVMWAGLAFLVALVGLALTGLRAWCLFVGLRRRRLAALTRPAAPLSGHDLRRCRDVAAFQALHRLVGGHALRLSGWFAAGTVPLAVAGLAGGLAHTRPVPAQPTGWEVVLKTAVDIGDSLLGWLPVAISGVGLLVYRNDTVRRSVGVLWDVGTFWPRAAHPLAPPSYAERAVPQLQTRTAGLLALPATHSYKADAIILSGHSQGAVISAAVILQMPAQWRRRIWFFSYGCQFTRLYGRVFPAFFGPDRLRTLTAALSHDDGADPDGGGGTDRPGGHAEPGWTNFWRDTDPLGWQVTAGEREVVVRDPAALHPSGGEVTDPPIRNHSGYPEAPEYRRERARVATLLSGAIPAPRAGTG